MSLLFLLLLLFAASEPRDHIQFLNVSDMNAGKLEYVVICTIIPSAAHSLY